MEVLWTLNLLLLFTTAFVLSAKPAHEGGGLRPASPAPQRLLAVDATISTHSHQGSPPAAMSLTLTPDGATTTTSTGTSTGNKSSGAAAVNAVNAGFIQIVDPPEVVGDGITLRVQYACVGAQKRVGLELAVWTARHAGACAFAHSWRCMQKQPEVRRVVLRMRAALGFRPSHWNPVSVGVAHALLRAWVVDETTYALAPRCNESNFRLAAARAQYAVRLPVPYDRPEAPATHCYTWWRLLAVRLPYRPQCALQPEVVTLVGYPVALSGNNYGVIRALPNYTNKELEEERIAKMASPKWTMVVYLYIMEYCSSGRLLCSIFQRLKWDDLYMTPLIYINQLGQLHLQLVCESGEAIAHLTPFSLPKREWVRLVVALNGSQWFVTVNYGENWKANYHTVIRVVTRSPVWYDSEPSLHIIGGSEITPSFKGYVGHAKVYRRLLRKPENIPYPEPNNPMFGLGIGEKAKRCHSLLQWITYRIQYHRKHIEAAVRGRKCPGGFYTLFPSFKHANLLPQCDKQAVHRSSAYRFARQWVRRAAYTGWQFKLTDVGEAIYNHAIKQFEKDGFQIMNQVVQLLKQASCYGNHDASYFLASILNHGVGIKADEITSHHYLMHATQENHRLSLLALGNKHVYGMDGIPQDLEQSYVYYKNMGDQSRHDRELHAEDDVFTEKVRLTDEESINEQTDEDGDLFLWFHHQAAQGVVHAQRDLARIMFWGSQGIKRNIKAAVEYYRISAESGEPSALFDYGIVLLKGQGTVQNYTGALHYLRKAAALGHAGAYNALGWYALEVSQNYTEARNLFMKAHKLGNTDATHNIGHMYLGGRHPDSPGVDRIKAFDFFSQAALRGGQYDSSIMVAMYNMRGHPNATRDPDLAVNWARYVSETNPALGRILAKGLKAFRHKNWPAAIMYYMLAADAGIEVGNFNLAMLCEENYDGLTSYIEKECVWKFYRLATRREAKFVDSYSWIKLGDYHWYGCEGKRDPSQAVVMYANAAVKEDPHALFNLGFLVEEGIYVPEYIWNGINVPKEAQASNVTLLKNLYYRCKESVQTEAYLPCSLALLRVEALDLWNRHQLIVKLSSVLGTLVAAFFSLLSAFNYFRSQRPHVTDV